VVINATEMGERAMRFDLSHVRSNDATVGTAINKGTILAARVSGIGTDKVSRGVVTNAVGISGRVVDCGRWSLGRPTVHPAGMLLGMIAKAFLTGSCSQVP